MGGRGCSKLGDILDLVDLFLLGEVKIGCAVSQLLEFSQRLLVQRVESTLSFGQGLRDFDFVDCDSHFFLLSLHLPLQFVDSLRLDFNLALAFLEQNISFFQLSLQLCHFCQKSFLLLGGGSYTLVPCRTLLFLRRFASPRKFLEPVQKSIHSGDFLQTNGQVHLR